MDTRAKVIPFENLPTLVLNDEWIVVPGLFDPMTALQASRLRGYAEIKRNLAVVVLDRPGTLLDSSSRTLLVAALRCVSAVAVATLEQFRKAIFHCETVPYNEAEDRELSEEFIDFVTRREMQSS